MDLESAPHTVIVHRAGATVERRVVLTSPRSGAVRLPGLPLALLDDSVSVRVDGDAEVRAVKVELHARPREDSPLTPDHAALQRVRRELAHARRRRDQLDAEREVFEGLPMPERPDPPEGAPIPPSPLAARVALDAFVDEQVAARHAARRVLDPQIEALETEEAALLDAIRRAQGARQARPDELSKAVTGELVVRGEPAEIALVLAYRVPGARWVPQYALDVARDGSRATLTLRAAIAQASGEDWSGVQLVLSTAEPLAPCPLPVLHALRIGRAQAPPPAPQPRPAPVGADRLFADYDRARRALQPPPPPPPLAPPEPVRMPESRMQLAFGGANEVDDDEVFADAAPVVEREEAPRREMAKRSARAAPPPMASMASAPAPKARQRAETADGPGAAPDAPEIPSFDRLRLRAPDHARRGTLEVVREAERHRELFERLGLELGFDPGALLASARRRAQAVGALALPGGAVAVHPDRFDHAMRADAPVDVPGDGAWHTLPLLRAAGDCALRYVSAPRVEPALYRVARLPNPLGCPLLPGPVEVYVDGAYVLTTSLPAAGPGEALSLGLGVEPALRVARNTRFHEARSGDRVAMTELHHHVAIEVHNTLARPAEIELRERVPQPERDAEVAVDEVAIEPPWEPWDQRAEGRELLGGRRWTLTVPPGVTSTLSAHYVVRMYANHEVVGGNRREA